MYNLILAASLLAVLFQLFGCDQRTGENINNLDQPVLIVHQSGVALRSEPHEEGTAIRGLKPAAPLYFLDEVAPGPELVMAGGSAGDRVWIKVKTGGGTEGWVTEDDIYLADSSKALSWKKSLIARALLGDSLYQLLPPGNDLKLESERFNRDQKLRKKIGHQLAQHTIRYPHHVKPPNYFWLQSLSPDNTIWQWSAPTRTYQLYADFGAYYEKCTDDQAKKVFELLSILYSPDSIEKSSRIYTLPVPDDRTYDLAGRGHYINWLRQSSTLSLSDSIFKSLIHREKAAAINQLTAQPNYYWLPLDSVKMEVQAILSDESLHLSKSERVSLETRLEQLQSPAFNGLYFNARSGVLEDL